MRQRYLRTTAYLLTLVMVATAWPALGADAPKADGPQLLKEAVDLYRQAQFEGSLARVRQALDLGIPAQALAPGQTVEDPRVRAQQICAFSAFALGDEEGARQAIVELLKLSADFDVDRGTHGVSPALVSFFDKVASETSVTRGDLEGTVTVAGKRPAAGVEVGAQGQSATTDATGRFALKGLRAGRVRLWVSGESISDGDALVEVKEGASTATVSLQQPALADLTAMIADAVGGGCLPGVAVRLGQRKGVTDDRGRVLFKRVPTGRRELYVEPAQVDTIWYRETRQSVEVSAKAAPVRITLQPQGPGLIVRSDPPGASIRVDDEECPGLRTPSLVTGLVPGWHNLQVEMPEGYSPAMQFVEVPEKGVAVVGLSMPRAAVVKQAGAGKNKTLMIAGGAAAAGGLALALSGGGGAKAAPPAETPNTASLRGYVFSIDYPTRAAGLVGRLIGSRQTTTTRGKLFIGRDRTAPAGCTAVAGAQVTISDGSATYTVTAGADGGFAFTGPLSSYTVTVQREGYEPATTTVDLLDPQQTELIDMSVPDVVAPTVGSATAAASTQVDVTFGEALDSTSAATAANYTLFPPLTISGAELRSDGKTVRLTTVEQTSGTNYVVTVTAVRDAAGNAVDTKLNTASFTGTGTPPEVDTATALSSTQVEVVFDEAVDASSASTVGYYSFTPALPVVAATRSDDGKTVLLTTAEQTTDVYRLTVSGVKDAFGNAISGTGSSLTLTGRGEAPEVRSADADGSTHVQVLFSEPVQAASAEIPTNYTLVPALTVTAAELQSDGLTVRLTTGEQTGGTAYSVSVNRVKDAPGNLVGNANTAAFIGVGDPPQVGKAIGNTSTTVDVVFNEPVQSSTATSESNYVFNPPLAVREAQLLVDGKTVRLTTTEQTADTPYTVRVASVTDAAGNPVGEQGSSATFLGLGEGPQVSAATVQDGTHLDLAFTEPLRGTTATVAANYQISPALTVVNAVILGDGRTVRLTTTEQTGDTTYTVTAAEVTDTAGNPIGTTGNTAVFLGVGQPPEVRGAATADSTHVDVSFSELVQSDTATLATNYTITPALDVSAAQLKEDGKSVQLTTAEQASGTRYTVTASGVTDAVGNPIGNTGNFAGFFGMGEPPRVASAAAVDSTHVALTFNEAVDSASAEVATNYTFAPLLTVSSASLGTDGKTVTLTTSEQESARQYSVASNGVHDVAGNASGGPGNSAAFEGIGVSPQVVSAEVVDNRHATITFSEVVENGANVAGNYKISPSLIVRIAERNPDGKTVTLTTDGQVALTTYTIVASGVRDAAGNTVDATANSGTFTGVSGDSAPPTVLSAAVFDSTHADALFSEDVSEIDAEAAGNYGISGLTVVAAELRTDRRTVRLTTSEQVTGTAYTVTVSSVPDLAGNVLVAPNNTAGFTGVGVAPTVMQAIPVDGTTVEVEFSEPLDEASAEVPGSYTFSPAPGVPAAPNPSAVEMRPDGKTVRLTVAELTGGVTYTLAVTPGTVSDRVGNPTGAQGNTATFATPGSGPKVFSAVRIDSVTVLVQFSEALDAASATTATNYALTPARTGNGVTAAVLEADGQTVRLTTEEQTTGIGYTVTVSNVKDLVGNMLEPTARSASFTGAGDSPAVAAAATWVSPTQVDVTFSEPVENGSAEALSSYAFSPALTVASAVLQAADRVRLTASEQKTGQGYTITASGVKDKAGNSIDAATLADRRATFTGQGTAPTVTAAATVVDSTHVVVAFSESVSAGLASVPGNYAIAPALAVSDAVLLGDGRSVRLTTATQAKSSAYTIVVANVTDLAGNVVDVATDEATFTGTDTVLPLVVSAAVSANAVDSTTVDLVFSEDVEATSANTAANYKVTPDRAVTAAVLQLDNRTVKLTVAELVTGTGYTVTVAGVKDAAGNTVAAPYNAATFTGTGAPPIVAVATALADTLHVDVVFNEELDPASANTLSNYSIPGLSITAAALDGTDFELVHLTTAEMVTGTGNYTVTVTGVKDVAGNQVGTPNTAAFDGIGQAPIVMAAVAVDSTHVDVTFSEAVLESSAAAVGNYAINNGLAVADAVLRGDGTTVRLTTSQQTTGTFYTVTVGLATDLAGNLVGAPNNATFTGVASTGPKVVTAESVDNTHVLVTFDKALLDDAVLAATGNYSIKDPVLNPLAVSSAVLQADGKSVFLTTAAQTPGTVYTVTISNVTDTSGSPVAAPNNSASFGGRTMSGAVGLRAASAGGSAWAFLTPVGMEPLQGAARTSGPRFVPGAEPRSPVSGRSWAFTLEAASGGGEVTLFWPGLAGLGAKERVTLEDLDANVSRNMRTSASYVFRGESRRFRVTAEKGGAAPLMITELALESAGRGSARVARITLSAAADLDLDVVTPTGALLAEVARGQALPAGTSRMPLRANLPPGFYLLRAWARSEDQTVVQSVRPVVIAR